MKKLTLVLVILLVQAGSPLALSRENNFPLRNITAVRADFPPKIDGRLDEPCWKNAPTTTNFIEDKYDRPATEQTIVRLAYNDEFIYIAFECLEPEPNQIRATERKYDRSMKVDDWVQVRFDTFCDKRCYYLFRTNTLATRYDARSGIFDTDDNWDCNWNAACTIEKDRWFAELAIPFADMHFDRTDNATWGINFSREEKGAQETSYWSYQNKKPRYSRNFGQLDSLNLNQVKTPLRPKYETYVSSTWDKNRNTTKFSTGADIALRLNPQIISTFTVNPDFGQVESDPDTIELRDTERFLEERRPFFKEGGELFESMLNVYYSRRFTDIDAGAKITGQAKQWSMGMLALQGEIERNDETRNGNFLVGRMIRNIGQNSHIGAIFTGSNRNDGSNFVGGLDTRIYFNSDTYLTSQLLGLSDSLGIETDESSDKNAYASYTNLRGGTKPWFWSFSYRDITRGFKPDLGYISRRNIRGPSGHVGYEIDIEDGPIKWYSLESSFRFYQNNENQTTLRDFDQELEIGLRNELQFGYDRSDDFHDPYNNYYDRYTIGYNQVDQWNSVEFGYTKGHYQGDPYNSFSFEKPLKLTDRLVTTMVANYRQWQLPAYSDDPDTEWLWRWVTEYVFFWDGRVKFIAEKTSEDRHNYTMLFSWPIARNMDFFFELSDINTSEEIGRGAFSKFVYRF